MRPRRTTTSTRSLLALVAELRERTGTLTLQPRAATNLPHSLTSQHGAADKIYKLFSMAKFSLFVAVSLLAPITTIGKAPIVDNSTGFPPLSISSPARHAAITAVSPFDKGAFSHQLAPPRPTIRRGFFLKLYQFIQPERGPVQIGRGYREPKCSLT